MMNWQPIETAPKDEEVLVLRRDGVMHVAKVSGHFEHRYGILSADFGDASCMFFFPAGMNYGAADVPTHWMPLPQPQGDGMMTDEWCPENDGAYRMELAARERDTITSLRERLEQAEREIGEWKKAANRSHEEYYAGGFRAGIEAAAERIESTGFSAGLIRALAEQKGEPQ